MPIMQTTDINQAGLDVPGLAFTADLEERGISSGVKVTSANGDGVSNAGFEDVELQNFGTIISLDDDGVSFDEGGDVDNVAGAEIFGEAGVSISGESGLVQNAGLIRGNLFGVQLGTTEYGGIANSGTISGSYGGVGMFGGGAGSLAFIVNTGTIEGLLAGIYVVPILGELDVVSIENYGLIRVTGVAAISEETFALGLLAKTSLVKNKGTIVGNVYAEDGDDTLVNDGVIEGRVEFNGGADTITNTGSIKGLVSLGHGADVLTSTGAIEGDVALGAGDNSFGNDGIVIGSVIGGDDADAVTNTVEIRGDVALGAGANSLVNSGTITGKVTGGADGDTVTNTGAIGGDVALGAGNDVFNGAGGVQSSVSGEDGNDVLTGGDGAEWLYGGAGDDTLGGGLGSDMLYGGAGLDQFVFDTKPNTETNIDTIGDFSQADGDLIVLSTAIYTKIGGPGALKGKYFEVGKKPLTKNDKIVYNEKKGLLMYAKKGVKTDKADIVKFAKVEKGLELDHTDFLLI